MSTAYSTIEKQTASLLNALTGATSTTAESGYTGLTYGDPRFNQTLVRDAILDTEEQIINAICSVPNHPQRVGFIATSSALANAAVLPTTLGPYGVCRDASDGIVCTPRPLRVVQLRTSNENSMFSAAVYHFAIDGGRLFHTRSNVTIEVTAFARPTFSGSMSAPDEYAMALVAGALGLLFGKEESYMTAATYYSQIFEKQLQMILQIDPLPKFEPFPTN